jgi:hypothetical protein
MWLGLSFYAGLETGYQCGSSRNRKRAVTPRLIITPVSFCIDLPQDSDTSDILLLQSWPEGPRDTCNCLRGKLRYCCLRTFHVYVAVTSTSTPIYPPKVTPVTYISTMFNRDRVPGLPGSSPRPPQRSDGYGRPPQQQPAPQHDTRMGGYEDRPPPGYGAPRASGGMPQRGSAPGGLPRTLRPVKSAGGNSYAFGNMLVTSLTYTIIANSFKRRSIAS